MKKDYPQSILNILGMAAMVDMFMNAPAEKKNDLRPEDINVSMPQAKPPNGCKEYWFTQDGRFHNGDNNSDRIRKDETVFYCHSINDANAKKKFEKFIKKQSK